MTAPTTMDPVTHIRPASPADGPAVGALTRQVYLDGGFVDPERSPDYLEELSDGDVRIEECQVFVAVQGDRIVGTVAAMPAGATVSNIARDGELELRMLAVATDMRGRGIASALVKACEHHATESGLGHVVLSTAADMSAAQRLYRRLGYHRTPARDWTAEGMSLLTFARELE